MKALRLFVIVLALAVPTAPFSALAYAATIGCPTGQALQSIDLETGQLVCVPGGGTAAQLVDREDIVIGQYMGDGVISRELLGYRVDICCIVAASGAALPGIAPSPLFASADCQGTAYFFADPRIPDPLYRVGSLLPSGDIVFGGDPATRITPLSFMSDLEGCVAITDPGFENVPVQPVVSVPLSTLGAPPFKVR